MKAGDPVLWFYAHKMVEDPHDVDAVMAVNDSDEDFQELLDAPEVIHSDEEKHNAAVLCGAKYAPGATNRDKENVDEVTCLVLDVDYDSGQGIPSEEELRSALDGLRAVVYASPSHQRQRPSWRVLLPLAEPLPPKKHRALVTWLSENLVPSRRGCINVSATGDPCRLGFVRVTKHPEDYTWFALKGERFSWLNIELADEEWSNMPLTGMSRQPNWIDRETAFLRARKEAADVAYRSVEKDDEHRTIAIFNIAMSLWWDWAAEDEDFVRDILVYVNSQFWEPKELDVVEKKMREAHQRTVGERRRPQHKGPYGFRREPSTSVSLEEIRTLARRFKKSMRPGFAGMGEELLNLVEGRPISKSSDVWLGALKRATSKLAEQFSQDSATKIASFFGPSLATMRARNEGDVPTVEQIEAWVGTALEGARKRKEERQKFADRDLAMSILHATKGKREHKYTPQEWDAFQENGCGLTDKSVLLQCGRQTWVFVDGTYSGPYSEAEFDAQGYKDLAAAQDFVKARYHHEEKGWCYVKLNRLLQEYGSACAPQIDYMCERSYFRPEDRVLVLAGPAKSGYEPKFHEDVDEWLRRMTGRPTPINEKVRREQAAVANVGDAYDDYDITCDWLASVTQLDHTCAALYLQGEKHSGKNLFAKGVGRIWKEPPTSPKIAFHHFNGPIADSPLIHADEDLSVAMTTALLRREISEYVHEYTRKHRDTGKIIGCFRLIITANNLNVFTSATKTENLNADDVNAFGDRFVRVKCRPEAKDFLVALGPRAKAFHDQGLLAEHTLWLVQQRWNAVKARGHRFLVTSRTTDVALTVATSVDLTSEICTLLANALAGLGDGTVTRVPDWFVVRDGKVWMHAASTRTALSMLNLRQQMTEKDVVRAIQSVSDGHRNMRVTVSKTAGTNATFQNAGPQKTVQQKMWNFRLDALRAFLENTPLRDWEEIEAGIAKLDEKDV